MRFRYPFYVILGASGVQMRLKNHYNDFVYFLQNSTANYFRKIFSTGKNSTANYFAKENYDSNRRLSDSPKVDPPSPDQ